MSKVLTIAIVGAAIFLPALALAKRREPGAVAHAALPAGGGIAPPPTPRPAAGPSVSSVAASVQSALGGGVAVPSMPGRGLNGMTVEGQGISLADVVGAAGVGVGVAKVANYAFDALGADKLGIGENDEAVLSRALGAGAAGAVLAGPVGFVIGAGAVAAGEAASWAIGEVLGEKTERDVRDAFIQVDVTNKNSAVRAGLRYIDPSRWLW